MKATSTPAEVAQAFGNSVGEIWNVHPGAQPAAAGAQLALQADYLKQATELWNQTLQKGDSKTGRAVATGASPRLDWAGNPASAWRADVPAQRAHADADGRGRQKATRRPTSAACASRCSSGSMPPPEQLPRAQPGSAAQGARDQGREHQPGPQAPGHGTTQQGHLSQTDESVFEVGRNVATTEGAVVFENELFQLIEYKAADGQGVRAAHAVRAAVHQQVLHPGSAAGQLAHPLHRRAGPPRLRRQLAQPRRIAMAATTWDDYIGDGRDPGHPRGAGSPAPQRSTRWASASAAPSSPPRWRCWRRAASTRPPAVTLLTTLLDFTEHRHPRHLRRRGPRSQVREMTIGPDAPKGGPGCSRGQELATTFSFLRPNDLVWNYVVGNYLKGETPPPFDLLYWNGDSTNLPGPDVLLVPAQHLPAEQAQAAGRLTVCGEPVDLRRGQGAGLHLRFARGPHRALGRGLPLDPGAQRRRSASCWAPRAHRRRDQPASPRASAATGSNGSAAPPPQDWFDGATEHPGSWWTDWA